MRNMKPERKSFGTPERPGLLPLNDLAILVSRPARIFFSYCVILSHCHKGEGEDGIELEIGFTFLSTISIMQMKYSAKHTLANFRMCLGLKGKSVR
ncbi:Uncharacterized protein APZ42_023892 [Daphnia magna]|uniref:Uncharacterized protein n=1 Tax=Daphnia magna TaxID=35525 RepID=A0A0P6BR20_9CRUS|nr:Uncharacterized protein APZ42_023892 [Daphnia magna]